MLDSRPHAVANTAYTGTGKTATTYTHHDRDHRSRRIPSGDGACIDGRVDWRRPAQGRASMAMHSPRVAGETASGEHAVWRTARWRRSRPRADPPHARKLASHSSHRRIWPTNEPTEQPKPRHDVVARVEWRTVDVVNRSACSHHCPAPRTAWQSDQPLRPPGRQLSTARHRFPHHRATRERPPRGPRSLSWPCGPH